jgi:hypothetical protein
MQLIVGNFCQDLHDLGNQRVGGFESNAACLHCLDTAHPGQGVETGEVNDHKFPQTENFAEQLATAVPDVGSKLPTTLKIEKRLGERPSGRADERADVMLQKKCRPGSGLGCFGRRRGGGRNIGDGGIVIHGALSEQRWQA